jgi:hypothetical protein
MAATQNSVCITQGKFHKIIYFHNFSMIKDLINKNVIFFVIIGIILVFF